MTDMTLNEKTTSRNSLPLPVSQQTDAPSTLGSEGDATDRALSPTTKPTFWTHLTSDIDPSQATVPLVAFCFMTGFMYVKIKNPILHRFVLFGSDLEQHYSDAISFSATFVWCAFQTGNFIQVSFPIPPVLLTS
jgi:hypothetical protein